MTKTKNQKGKTKNFFRFLSSPCVSFFAGVLHGVQFQVLQ
ncbi:hypothetical protein GPEL0_01f4268 [Geoanaerobacter pelophilus]|uniref:Uncharacterized protein n=1 Tax=Geoanaerobacter pelophilus TaxID=60036 RepID=A0ABQ0MLZ3_9BACT|nr:hypothetical protein GPEL0_01f4268 [Geoanaerobacter pelophilus]